MKPKIRHTVIVDWAEHYFGAPDFAHRTRQEFLQQALRIKNILLEGPPYPERPEVQMWVGALDDLDYYIDCMKFKVGRENLPEKRTLRTSWATSIRVLQANNDFLRRWKRRAPGKYLMPRNTNRGKIEPSKLG